MDSLHPNTDLEEIDWSKEPGVERASTGEFQLLYVDAEKIKLKDFIDSKDSMKFDFHDNNSGNTYYEWRETLKELKQNVDIVLMDTENGGFYTGNGIRRRLDLPDRGGAFWNMESRKDISNFSPRLVRGREKFPIFISSTSVARTVKKGARILYRRGTLGI